MLPPESLDAKKARLERAMRDRRRWSASYQREIARMPEDAVDRLLIYYTSPIHVG